MWRQRMSLVKIEQPLRRIHVSPALRAASARWSAAVLFGFRWLIELCCRGGKVTGSGEPSRDQHLPVAEQSQRRAKTWQQHFAQQLKAPGCGIVQLDAGQVAMLGIKADTADYQDLTVGQQDGAMTLASNRHLTGAGELSGGRIVQFGGGLRGYIG